MLRLEQAHVLIFWRPAVSESVAKGRVDGENAWSFLGAVLLQRDGKVLPWIQRAFVRLGGGSHGEPATGRGAVGGTERGTESLSGAAGAVDASREPAR